jgi:hypothetical protein
MRKSKEATEVEEIADRLNVSPKYLKRHREQRGQETPRCTEPCEHYCSLFWFGVCAKGEANE